MKKLALFDIDGVVYDGHSIFDLIQDQEKRGFVKPGLWLKIEEELGRYKIGEKSYKEAADSMLSYYARWLKGKKFSELIEDNKKFIKSGNKILPYFQRLVSILEKTHDIYLVTTNFDCAASAFNQLLNLKGFLSSELVQENGIVTGEVGLSLGGNKGIVSGLIFKYGKKGSVAVGDSENDVDMLEKVEYPFVIEPNDRLKAIAKTKGWHFVNRDNILDIITSNVG